ncbi:MAG: flagellar hook protein FlgE [Thiobacillus sp. SCN 64-35]|jgi:flagellar hook protein FlgE|nr:flagellar hook protein FlgE [Betaproteobacteria bacterium SCN1]MBN8761692.1 flagellar hook protein FlgE [Thiobacillus sp.]ODU08419.1 MAG: flagellar hook protein FlgE [Thiobacillus sp. SCN 64-35]ODU87173.1 MAG: flagellar hook protein FlgE [Thiobacillus sp. SCN 65-179]OJW36913.1 MAG: flagellar hook protein FlgE [Thiobacillus sp. 65-69]
MSFQQGLSGLNAAAKNLDAIGNNVANSGTVGYKQSQAQFADVYANSLTGAGGSQIGIGVQLATVAQQFTQGNITTTNNPLDIAINGNGFFRMDNNGEITYQRNGQFQLDRNGYIISPSGANLTGYTANASGVLSTGAPAPLYVSTTSLPPQQSSEVTAQLTLDSTKTPLASASFNQNDPTTFHNATSVSIYDSLGNAHTLQTYYVKTASGTWDVFASVDGAAATSVGTLAFNTDGALTTAMPLSTSVAVTTGATTPFSVDIDYTGTTQYGAPFSVDKLVQDGYTAGRLAGFSIGSDGVILGRYTNGESAVLGQVVLASFANPNGLKPIGNNMWTETAQSGSPLVGAPDSGNLGVLQSSAVEDSNVDLTAELVNMITAQRVYQANAQTIKAQDAVLQTLVNLR